jgi:mycoredoxin
MSDLYNLKPSQIVLYGVSWCGDCHRARKVLAEKQTLYLDIDIDADAKAAEFVVKNAKGFRSVPTIVFPDGTVMIEPSTDELAAKLS